MALVERHKKAKQPKHSGAVGCDEVERHQDRHHHRSALQAPASGQWSEPVWIDEYKRGMIRSRYITQDEAQRLSDYDKEWNLVWWHYQAESYIHSTWCGLDMIWHTAEPQPIAYPAPVEDTILARDQFRHYTYVSGTQAATASDGQYGKAKARPLFKAEDAREETRFVEGPIIVTEDPEYCRRSRGSRKSSDSHKSHGSSHSRRSHKSHTSHGSHGGRESHNRDSHHGRSRKDV